MVVRCSDAVKNIVMTDKEVVKVAIGEIMGVVVLWLFLCQLLPN